MKVITVANQKGGVGKTTTSVALAGLVAQRGQRVLLVDVDPHGSMTSYFKIDHESLTASTFTLFNERNQLTQAKVMSTIQDTSYPNLSIIPAVTLLATLERQGIGDGMGLVLVKVFKMLREDYDYVFIDCPPQLGVLMVNALAACDHLVIPVQTEFLAIKGLERILNTLMMLNKSTQKVIPYTIVPTMFDRRTQASVTSLRNIRLEFGEPVWPGKIPVDTRFRDASKAGVPPNIYDEQSRGVTAYESLLRYIEDHQENDGSAYDVRVQ